MYVIFRACASPFRRGHRYESELLAEIDAQFEGRDVRPLLDGGTFFKPSPLKEKTQSATGEVEPPRRLDMPEMEPLDPLESEAQTEAQPEAQTDTHILSEDEDDDEDNGEDVAEVEVAVGSGAIDAGRPKRQRTLPAATPAASEKPEAQPGTQSKVAPKGRKSRAVDPAKHLPKGRPKKDAKGDDAKGDEEKKATTIAALKKGGRT